MSSTEYHPIEDHPALVKDVQNGAIINIDDNAYEAALKRKERGKQNVKMRKDIDELKSMMELILKKLDK
tara:strand:+ start:2325 stop:2531 length:207 start_codon:yes stop_codon:yes gene_type:complete